MSLPWNKAVCLHVGAQAVTGTLHAAWSPRKVLARATQLCAQPADHLAGTVGAGFGAAMEAVLDGLQPGSSGSGHLQVLLADARVHLDVVAGDYREASERQLQTIASACVDEVLGHRPAAQAVRWQLQPGMRHLLIAAMDAEDVGAVLQVAAQRRLTLRSLQPAFCAQWNQHAVALPGGTGVFAVVEGTHVVVAFARDGAIRALSSGSCAGPAAAGSDTGGHNALDARADRLLASLGQDATALSAFILVSSGSVPTGVASRWAVIGPQEASA